MDILNEAISEMLNKMSENYKEYIKLEFANNYNSVMNVNNNIVVDIICFDILKELLMNKNNTLPEGLSIIDIKFILQKNLKI